MKTEIQKQEIKKKYEELELPQVPGMTKVRAYELGFEEFVDRAFNSMCFIQELVEEGAKPTVIVREINKCRNIVAQLVEFKNNRVTKVKITV